MIVGENLKWTCILENWPRSYMCLVWVMGYVLFSRVQTGGSRYMAGVQNVFSPNDALFAIPWGPASKFPLNSNNTQTAGMLNMKACQLQKL